MKLSEDFQDEVIQQFQNVLDAYKAFREECTALDSKCDSNKDLKFSASYLNDFCMHDLLDQINSMKEEILDLYYPVDYGDDEEDSIQAGERYKDSKETRDNIFK